MIYRNAFKDEENSKVVANLLYGLNFQGLLM